MTTGDVSMTIEDDGRVSRVGVSGETQFATCVKAELHALVFPRGDDVQQVKLRLRLTVIVGSMDKEIIRRVVNEHASQVRSCYARALLGTPGVAGRIKVKWVIAADGGVTEASVESAASPQLRDAVAPCLIEQILTWRFPKPKGRGTVIVSYPFVFKQSS